MGFRRPDATSFAGRALALVESRVGVTVADAERYRLLEEVAVDYGVQERMLDLLGWHVLDNYSGREQEVKFESRKVMARKARIAWMHDPMVGGAVSLMNDFTLGRGVPKPRCNDKLVQERMDEAWDDPDNQRVLTGFLAQIALNTDISLQSNILFLIFDDGDDGRVKLSTLNYDSVEDAVTDPENRHRVLWYVAKERKAKWDFKNHKWAVDLTGTGNDEKKQRRYYEHWHNVKDADEEEGREEKLVKPAEEDLGKGRVYHVAINRTTEMVFGVPEWQRVLKWATAYNDFMKSRVDMVKAAAAFAMKRKITGSPNQVAKMAAKAVGGRGPLAAFPIDPDEPAYGVPPMRGGAIINENEGVTHESFKIDSGAANAQLDAANLRSQFSAATRWPQHYLGAGDGPGLATATAMELPVLKMVETRQEILEGIYRWFIDRVIERAVESGKIPKDADPDEADKAVSLEQALQEAAAEPGVRLVSITPLPKLAGRSRMLLRTRKGLEDSYRVVLDESHEDKTDDERDTERDLGYTFGLPSPLRRMMADLISSIASIARTFDPNNTNLDLSRHLLYVALGEGLEVENAQDMVEEIFPEGYEDPAIAAAQAQAAGGGADPNGNFFGPDFAGADGQQHQTGNPYGAPMSATPAEKVPGAQEAAMPVRRRDGSVRWVQLREGRLIELPDDVQDDVRMRQKEVAVEYDTVLSVAREELALLAPAGTNGNGNGNGTGGSA